MAVEMLEEQVDETEGVARTAVARQDEDRRVGGQTPRNRGGVDLGPESQVPASGPEHTSECFSEEHFVLVAPPLVVVAAISEAMSHPEQGTAYERRELHDAVDEEEHREPKQAASAPEESEDGTYQDCGEEQRSQHDQDCELQGRKDTPDRSGGHAHVIS
jgi:hypothetical protein